MKNLQTDLKPAVRIVLLGFTGSGKRSSQKTILDLVPPLTGHKKLKGVVAGRLVTVVDTAGWYRKEPVLQTPELVRKEIEYSVFQCVPGPHAFLLVVNVDAPFREQDRESMAEHVELLGERVWAHTILLFTFGDWLGDTTIQEHIESEGEALQWLVRKCGNRYHLLSNVRKGDGSQVLELLEKIEEMVSGKREEAFYKVHLMGMEDEDEVEEDDWAYVWEKKTESMTSYKSNSINFPPPSFGSEDRPSSAGQLKTPKRRRIKSASPTPRSSGYGSLKSTPGYDCSSSEGSWASRLIDL